MKPLYPHLSYQSIGWHRQLLPSILCLNAGSPSTTRMVCSTPFTSVPPCSTTHWSTRGSWHWRSRTRCSCRWQRTYSPRWVGLELCRILCTTLKSLTPCRQHFLIAQRDNEWSTEAHQCWKVLWVLTNNSFEHSYQGVKISTLNVSPFSDALCSCLIIQQRTWWPQSSTVTCLRYVCVWAHFMIICIFVCWADDVHEITFSIQVWYVWYI